MDILKHYMWFYFTINVMILIMDFWKNREELKRLIKLKKIDVVRKGAAVYLLGGLIYVLKLYYDEL